MSWARTVAAVAIAAALAGCGLHRDFEPASPDAIKPGPGLFSGEDGVFTVYGERRDGTAGGDGGGVDKRDAD